MAKFDKVIPPGQEGTIHMVIQGDKVHDKFEKSAAVYTNDPNHAVMTISIAAEIVPYVEVQPTTRLYMQGYYGEKVEKELQVRSNEDGLNFEITGVESNVDDKITYTYGPGEEPGSWLVRVWKNPKLPTMSTYGSLVINTNSEKSPQKTIQVRVITKGSITVQPKMLSFGRVKFGKTGAEAQPITKTVLLLKNNGEFEVEKVTFDEDQFSADVEVVEPGKRYNVAVTFTPPERNQPNQVHTGSMTIYTNDPLEPQLTVKLVARSK